MNDRTILIALHELNSIGWKTILRLVNRYPKLSDLLGSSSDELIGLGLKPAQCAALQNGLTERKLSETKVSYEEGEIRVLTLFDADYPELLKQTSQPPWVLYAKGDLTKLKRSMLAMVGTRMPTVYGKKVAEDIAMKMSQAGFCVVSGLATGIDGCAHRGALKGRGGTIAVLGCGIDIPYPREHAPLYKEIQTNGLVLSEYPPGTAAKPGLFPMRNRIIAGLSWGTIVVEAAQRSGSLITADMALDESRDIFAVPGPITSPKSAGTNALIKQGAKVVMNAEELIEEYKHTLQDEQATYTSTQVVETRNQLDQLTAEERHIMQFLSCEPVTIDLLLEQSQTNFGHLHAILLHLLMKQRIAQLPGPAYIAI